MSQVGHLEPYCCRVLLLAFISYAPSMYFVTVKCSCPLKFIDRSSNLGFGSTSFWRERRLDEVVKAGPQDGQKCPYRKSKGQQSSVSLCSPLPYTTVGAMTSQEEISPSKRIYGHIDLGLWKLSISCFSHRVPVFCSGGLSR